MSRPSWKHTSIGMLAAIWMGNMPATANQQPLSLPTVSEHVVSESTTNSITDLLNQGYELYSDGRFFDAIMVWREATTLSEGNHLTQAIALNYLSSAYQALNQWDLAQQTIDQSLALLEADPAVSPLIWAQVTNTHAGLIYHLGQAETALKRWQSAEMFYQQAKDVSGMLGSQINQAQALQSLGFYRRSRQQLEAVAVQLHDKPDSELKVNGLRTLGNALLVLGDVSASRAALFESINIAIAINSTNELSTTYLSLGKTARDWGDPTAAIAMFDQAKQTALNPTDELQADLSRLRFYAEQREPVQARQVATNLAQLLKTLPPSRLSIYGTVNLSASLAQANQLGQSLSIETVNQLLTNAAHAAKDLQDAQAEAHVLNQWGALYMQTQQWAEALTLTKKSLDIARSINADDIAAQSAWQLGRILKQQNKTTEAIAAYSEAVDSLQALRSDLVAINPDVQFSFKENVEPIYREFVSLLLTSENANEPPKSKNIDSDIVYQPNHNQPNHNQPSQKSLEKAREVIEALQLAELDNFFQEACIDVESQQIDQVDTTATVIYPIILPDRLAVIASSAGQPLAYYSTLVSAEEVETTLRNLLSAIHPVSDNNYRLTLSQQVYDWLVRPAIGHPIAENTETMVFVLDGLLRNIPIAALHDGDHYLIEDYAVALSPGLQLMSARSLNQIEPDAIIGGISEARNGLSALPAVEDEVTDISAMISSETLFNEQFTSEALAKDVKNSSANIVHLATHGQFSSRLEDTFLSTWEGRLSVKELSEILQTRHGSSAIELLVLSACDTASGDDRAVLGLAGLAVQSGARSTVATLWPVKDKAAAKLMQELYRSISTANMSKAEALRQAQLVLLADPSFSDPFFWSAYTLVGNWQ